MTNKLVALVLLGLMTGTAVAEGPKVTPLMSKDLPENPGKEDLDDHGRARARRIELLSTDTTLMPLSMCWRVPS